MIIGFALFAMFFGAGNLIFPPFLGWKSGENWFIGFLCFLFLDIGMGLLAMIAIAKIGKGAEGITERLGKKVSFLLLSLTCLCIGPCIAIPRTAAITYEVGILPNLGEISSWLCTGLFFLISFLLSIRQSKVVDIVGKIMAPLMFAGLLVLIIRGFISPVGEMAEGIETGSVIREGLLAGYQTMDMMAACIFAIALLLTIRQKGYQEKKQQFSMIVTAGMVATVLLFVVYGGLAYIGATASGSIAQHLTKPQLLILLTERLLGKPGLVLLGWIVAFACLTTSVGLLTSIASYFEEKLHIRYEVLVTVFTVVSWIISNFGTAAIISMASPVLQLIYPVLIVLILFALLPQRLQSGAACRSGAAGAFGAAFLLQAENIFENTVFDGLLPMADMGFGWLVPAAVCGAAGLAIANIKRKMMPVAPEGEITGVIEKEPGLGSEDESEK